MAQNSLLVLNATLSKFFRDFVTFYPILVGFVPNKRFFKREGGSTFLVERVGGPL
jgi:hypothetical protein